MKTNITMKSEDRNLFGVIIRQETKTGFLNVSDLTRAYEIERSKKGWSYRRSDEIFDSIVNAERIYYILQKQGYFIDTQDDFIKGGISHFMKDVEKQGLKKVLKNMKAYKTTGRGDNKSVWADPYIWMLIAMELHPEIYATTVCWLADKLILNRIEAGNMYKGLTKAVTRFDNVDYSGLAKALNFVVFNQHETGIRNTASQDQLKQLEDLEKYLATSIEMGHIVSFNDLIQELREMYNKKWNPIKRIA
ncbi:hypothetical protein JGH11_16035 [Dysgonomonas sp. Marseille-P4677]|uniref:hypothetical protein n=1 Tax=Dysgonomonas sp. Marseille-P4677 TaxID=2364790 RepID=UPI001912DB78|nr:hypothetical protein [Dysgonomonas sp. Marseille-P4677]MBK5722386.1 hypothetical protein [Dysgonomonas sp. Marseille-P4677]